MTSNQKRWWAESLAEHSKNGHLDADRGVYIAPNDPTVSVLDDDDMEENAAYAQGWERRRRDLGTAFRWKGEGNER